MLFYLSHIGITYTFISRLNHSIDQIQMLTVPFAGFHRSA